MLRYMLDTDVCSYFMKRSNDRLLKRLQKTPVSEVRISVTPSPNCCSASKCLPDESKMKRHSTRF